MRIELNESEMSLRPKQLYTIKEILDFCDRWKLPLTKWHIAADEHREKTSEGNT